MKKWIKGKYKLAAIAVSLVALTSSVGVLAYTNLDFSNKAKEWQSKHCTEKELNSPSANDKSAICYSIDGVDKNTIEIEAVKQKIEENSGNDSIYTLINTDTSYPDNNINAGAKEVLIESMAPVDSVISSLTLLAKGGADKVIDSGKVDISVLVNGSDVAFGTYLDKEHTRNSSSSNEIEVSAGDVIQIKITKSNDLLVTGITQPSCQPLSPGGQICYPGSFPSLNLNIGLYLKAK